MNIWTGIQLWSCGETWLSSRKDLGFTWRCSPLIYMKFSQISDWTSVASEFKIVFFQFNTLARFLVKMFFFKRKILFVFRGLIRDYFQDEGHAERWFRGIGVTRTQPLCCQRSVAQGLILLTSECVRMLTRATACALSRHFYSQLSGGVGTKGRPTLPAARRSTPGEGEGGMLHWSESLICPTEIQRGRLSSSQTLYPRLGLYESPHDRPTHPDGYNAW